MVTKIEIPKVSVEKQNQPAVERADLSLELKEQKNKFDVKVLIDSIKSTEKLNENDRAVSALYTVLDNLILKGLSKGNKIEDIKRNPVVELQKYAKIDEEKAAMKKLNELVKNDQAFVSAWPTFCNKSEKKYTQVVDVKKSMEKGKVPKGHEWMPTTIRLGLLAGGFVGAYGMYEYIKHRNDEVKEGEKKKGLPWISAALTTMGVGAIIGEDRIQSFGEKWFGVTFSLEALKKFKDYILKLDFKNAFALFSFKNKYPGIEKAAEKLDIDKSFLVDFKDVTYENFHSIKGDLGRKTRGLASQALEFFGIDNSSNTIGTGIDDQLRNAEKEEKLENFIEAHKAEIKGKNVEKMTIAEILNEFNKLGTFDRAVVAKVESPEKSTDKPKIGDLETIGDNFPSAKATYEKYKSGEIGMKQAAVELINGTWDDGSALVMKEGSIFLVKNGVKYGFVACISSSAIWGDTIMDAYGIMKGDKGITDYLSDYWDDGGWMWIGGGAIIGAVKNDNVLRGAFKGAIEGFKWSYKFTPWVVKSAYKGLKNTAEMTKRLNFTTQELSNWLSTASDAEKAALYQERALHHAAEYQKYQVKLQKEEAEGIEGVTDKVLKRIFPNWTKEEMIGNGKFFIKYRLKYLKAMEALHLKTWEKVKGLPEGNAERIKAEANLRDVRNEISKPEFRMTNTEIENGIKNSTNGIETKLKDATSEFQTKPMVAELKNTATVKIKASEGLPEGKNKAGIESLETTFDQSEEYFNKRLDQRKILEAGNATEDVLKAFDAETTKELDSIRNKLSRNVDELNKAKLTPEESLAFERVLTQDLSKGTGVRAIMKRVGESVKGRGKYAVVIGCANIVIESYMLNSENNEAIIKKELAEMAMEVGVDTLQIILDVLCPYGISDWYTVFTGKESLTQKEVSGWSRLSRVVFGTYNVTTDLIATLAGGVTVEAGGVGAVPVAVTTNAIETAARVALKGAGKAPKIIEQTPKIIAKLTALAHDVGGFQGLLKIVNKWAGRGATATVVAGGALLTADLVHAGYEIMFDTKGQKEQIVEMSDQEKMAA